MAFGIDMGPSSQESANYDQLVHASQFATNTGEADITKSNAFLDAIMSGDATRIQSVLAPEISAAKTSAQQTNKTSAEMGTRSGGTGAATAVTNDKTHSDITDMIAKLTGGAVSATGSMGASLLGTGISGTDAAFGKATQMQSQRASKWNDIFNSAASVAAAPFTGGASFGYGSFSKPGKGGGGGGDFAPGWDND